MPISDDYQNYTRVERRINNVEILIGKMSGYMEKLDGFVDSQKKIDDKICEYMASQKTMNDNLLQILQKLSGV